MALGFTGEFQIASDFDPYQTGSGRDIKSYFVGFVNALNSRTLEIALIIRKYPDNKSIVGTLHIVTQKIAT
tara:strand:+ start:306 stop:518 length:213 start_codon:yes stop_codon:yes gene_type:complete